MLTWAIVYIITHVQSTNIGMFLFLALIYDTLMIISITACWWGKYFKEGATK